MRYFNTHGPVEIEQHYVVSRQALIDQLGMQIDQGKYFTIFAPRQMGKTTLLRKLDEMLAENPAYLPIPLSFERYETWAEQQFLNHFGRLIAYYLNEGFQASHHPQAEQIQKLLAESPIIDYLTFSDLFGELYRLAPECKVVLIIDEFDATPQEAISPLLQTWRTMYLERRPPHSLHNVILIGIQNIARLNFGRSSP